MAKASVASTTSSLGSTPRNIVKRHPDIVFIGSLTIDLHCYTSVLPKLSETAMGTRFHISFGGKGGNACSMCARLGGGTAMIGRVGADCFGKEYITRLKKLGVNVNYIKISEQAATGVIQYSINEQGKYYAIHVPNTNFMLTAADVANAKHMFKRIKVAVFNFQIPAETVLESMKLCKEVGVETLILSVTGVLDKLFFELATIIVLSKSELELATGDEVRSIPDAFYSLKKLLMKGCEIAVVTLGGLGALYITKTDPDTPNRVMIAPIDCPVDVTGAGDAFIGTLAYTTMNYKDLSFEQKIKISCEVARQTVLRYGAQDSYPFKQEVEHLFSDENKDSALN